MTFSFTPLGCNAAIPANDRKLSAHLLNADERLFLIDCGEGTQFQLRKFHISLQRIRHILISHLHGDHFFGLIGLLNSMHLLGRKEDLHVYGPPMLQEIIRIQLEVSMTFLNYQLHFHPLIMEEYDLLFENAKLTVHSFPLKHSIPTCGFVFREKNPPRKILHPRSFAYCSDTGYFEQMTPWISGVSLLYHEATFMQLMAKAANDKLHSTAAEAATIASKAGVKKLMLGHFSARYEDLEPLLQEALAVFPETILAAEGTEFNM
ncbi:MAG: ribonuclease Z [Bacteroidota bacterium]